MCHYRPPNIDAALTRDSAERSGNALADRRPGLDDTGAYQGFTAEERAAMKDHAHAVVTANAPVLAPKLG